MKKGFCSVVYYSKNNSLLIHAQLRHVVQQFTLDQKHTTLNLEWQTQVYHETKTETKAPFKPALSINGAFPVRRGHIPSS